MGQYIYQLSDKPIPKTDYYGEEDFYETEFLGRIASCIEPIKSRENALTDLQEWLCINCLGKYEKGMITLNSDLNESNYFAERYPKFIETANKLSAISEKEFCAEYHKISDLLYDLGQVLVNSWLDYVWIDTNEPMPIEQFIRTYSDSGPFYIGGIFSYRL